MNPITYKGQKVVTTEMLAEQFNVESKQLINNFGRNKKFYLEDIDFFLLKGSEIKDFATCHQIDVKSRTPKLYLWTESGALNHAKSLQNSEAWQIFINFRDMYFRQKEALKAIKEAHEAEQYLIEHTIREVQVANSKAINSHIWKTGEIEDITTYNRESCKLHSGKTPSQLRKEYLKQVNESRIRQGKKPIKTAPSGKEILRSTKPEVAASMSLTDSLVKHGGNLIEIAPLSIAVQPVFSKMVELGMFNSPKKIS